MNAEGGFQPSCSVHSPTSATAHVWPQPGLTGVSTEGTEMRKAWGDNSTGQALPPASVLGFQKVVGRLCPHAQRG